MTGATGPLRLPIHGALVAGCWLVHGGNHIVRGTGHDLLFACNAAMPLLALGSFLGAPLPCAIALLWLSFGTPMWMVDLARGAGLIPTSALVHFVAPLIGLLAIRRLGWPRRAAPYALGAIVLLLIVSRCVGAPSANVNLVFRIHPGLEAPFGHSQLRFLGALFVVGTVWMTLTSRVLGRVFRSPKR